MSFELCVNWPGDLNKAKELILKAYSFGYLGIAFNNTLNLVEKCNKLRSSPNKNSVSGNILSILAKEGHVCPIQYIQLEKEELRGLRKRSLIVKSNSGPLVPKNAYLPLSLSCHNFEINKQFGKEDDTSLDFFQLRRLSIVFDNPDCVPYINALSRGPCNESSDSWSKAIFSSVPNQPYDLVSVRPTTQNALNSAISSVECDIISIDISSAPRLPFIIKRPQINLAISRGIFFELDISQCILNKGNSRRNFFSNLNTLTRHVPHKNIIITCNPSFPLDIKTPMDLSNICHVLLSLDFDRKVKVNSFDFINNNAIKALAKGTNRRSFASVILINKKEEHPDQEMDIL
ncbi:hypothetical protein CHM_3g1620 [Cryptosporidium hominis]